VQEGQDRYHGAPLSSAGQATVLSEWFPPG
jgi:hypothetical protein